MRGISVPSRLLAERTRYLQSCGEQGGTASGFREWIAEGCKEDPRLFPYDGLRDEAATKAWQAQPRKEGPDLFSVAGVTIPEFLVRPKRGFVDDGASLDGDAGFEKVDARFATVSDRFEDALIKMRKAAQASTRAELDMKNADECRRLAGGDLSKKLRDLAD